MSKQKSQVSEKGRPQRVFRGEQVGKSVIEFLNHYAGRKQARDVESLIHLAQQMISYVRGRKPADLDYAKLHHMSSNIARILEHYPGRYSVGRLDLDRMLAFTFSPLRRPKRRWYYTSVWKAIHAVVALAERSCLQNVQRCAYDPCGRWFYAKYPHQVCCAAPARCQQKRYRSLPEFKAKRAKYMRDRYHREFSSLRRKP